MIQVVKRNVNYSCPGQIPYVTRLLLPQAHLELHMPICIIVAQNGVVRLSTVD